jgi:16S rRNA (cytidine1402-2'-O)-methyltransferase
VAELEDGGLTRRDAIAEAARRAGVPKRAVYDLVHKS